MKNLNQRIKRKMFIAHRLGYYYPRFLESFNLMNVGNVGGGHRQGEFECPACKGFGHVPDYDPYRASPDKFYVECTTCHNQSGVIKKLYTRRLPTYRRFYKTKSARAAHNTGHSRWLGQRDGMLAYRSLYPHELT